MNIKEQQIFDKDFFLKHEKCCWSKLSKKRAIWESNEKIRSQKKEERVFTASTRGKYAGKSNFEKRLIVLNFYSKGALECACCREKGIKFLSIDHINNDGAKHRREIGGNLCLWILKNSFPPGFQILCYNCNFSKGIYGKCPHLDLI